VEKCKKLNNAFFQLNNVVKSNANPAFFEDKDAKKKMNVIDRLYKVWGNNKAAFFRRWRETNGEARMR
jgi:hypothetical protein